MEKGNESKLKATAQALKKLDLKEFQYHKKTVEEVIKDLGTDLKSGLTQGEAEARLQKYGHNELEKEQEESLWEKIKESFEDLLVRILLLAAIVSFIIALMGKYCCQVCNEMRWGKKQRYLLPTASRLPFFKFKYYLLFPRDSRT